MTLFNDLAEKASHEYPGAYQPPAYNWMKVMQHLKHESDKDLKSAGVVSEDPCCYSVKIEVPGRKKEDFMVTLEDDKLNIYVLSAGAQSGSEPAGDLHEYSCDCFEHTVMLPKYVDADFVRAEYKAGVLRFDFPVTACECSRTVDSIIVY